MSAPLANSPAFSFPTSVPGAPLAASPAIPSTRLNLNLLDRIASFIERFVFLKDKALYRLLALWIVHTYLIDEFEYTPYLFVHSPERGCGKTCLLSVLDLLIFKSSGITASPTEAVLFRSAHGHTQILDEADTYLPRLETVRGILNAGYYCQGNVKRVDKDEKGKYTLQEFPVFAARVIAGIGSHILPVATRDRAFSIEMTRQIKSEKRERFRVRKLKPDVDAIVKSIEAWVKSQKSFVATRYASAFPYLEKFQDRSIDISEPVAAILEVAYADSPILLEARLEFIHSIALVRCEQIEESFDHRILGALVRASTEKGELKGNASELAEVCSNHGVSCEESDVSRALRQYGFETKSVRIDGDPRKRYVLSEQALSELSSRYLCSNSTESVPLETVGATTC